MNVIACAPGRYGDILWAMPTVRAIAEGTNVPVRLILPHKYGSLANVLLEQPYLSDVIVDHSWAIEETAPITPREPLGFNTWTYSADVHVRLGYRGWPRFALPLEVYRSVQEEHPNIPLAPLDLERPWIASPPMNDEEQSVFSSDVVLGFTDEWLELKVGLLALLERQRLGYLKQLCALGSRWSNETGELEYNWDGVVMSIATAPVFLGCCSALHVLACAMGKPCLIMEPNPQRHNPIFWPFGMDGPRVTCVNGNDGKPTHDARHVGDALRAALERVHATR